MKSPAEQKVIQVDITNACPHECSNCTRFVGHHKKPFMMDVATFEKAVRSLAGFNGMVGVMGGEPTIHPEFDKILNVYEKWVSPDRLPDNLGEPIKDFGKYRNAKLANIKRKRGLWTSLGWGYKKHYERIQEVFGYQCINDHLHDGKHLALLLPRSELGIKDDEWIKYRDACWVQNEWSASITPKGAFFCEVAGALDMLFDGEGGWDVEPGWWKRKPEDFGEQLKWCELCSACLPVPANRASQKRDIVSPKMNEKLLAMGSSKAKSGGTIVFDCAKYNADEYKVNKSCEPYIPDGDNSVRVSGTNRSLLPESVTAMIVCEGYDDYLDATLQFNKHRVKRIIVITTREDKKTQAVCKKHGVTHTWSERLHENGAKFAKGKAINEAFTGIDLDGLDWVLQMDADIILPDNFEAKIKELTLNPGYLYYTRRWGTNGYDKVPKLLESLKGGADIASLFNTYANKTLATIEGRNGNDMEHLPFGYFQLYNLNASVLRGKSWRIYPEGSNSAEYDDKNFGFEVFKGRTASLPIPEFDCIHLPHGGFQENWLGRRSVRLERVMRKEITDSMLNDYICMRRCTYRGKLYDIGDTLHSSRWDVPKHFRRVL